MDMPAAEREKALLPLYQLIENGYARQAEIAVVNSAKVSEGRFANSASGEGFFLLSVGEYGMEVEQQEFKEFLLSSPKLFEEVVSFVDASKIIENKAEVIDKLKNIERDCQYFKAHRSLPPRPGEKSAEREVTRDAREPR